MTQVKKWSNQELNRKLAVLMGYTIEWSKTQERWSLLLGRKIRATSSGTVELIWSYAPDYCTDPDASLEVQAKAIGVDENVYFTKLLTLKGVILSPSLLDTYCAIALATPRQRAEAAYMTLQAYQVDKQ